ncbi:MAG TPA: DUF5995 family protein [Blastocatellia bacterium]|nr:DUF5995 family protein [Blastocatellia bacterium]
MAALAPEKIDGAQTIDGVIERLDEIIAWAIGEESRLGYFAALYRKVTLKVKEGIQIGRFEDGPRIERLDVIFANRYLDAFSSFLQGERASGCWMVAFGAASAFRPIILQHLLLGINAHINFDLGIAAAQTSPGSQIASLKRDFDEINKILAGLVMEVENEINQVSPWINLLDHIDPSLDRAIINFSLDKARAAAWDNALELASISPREWGPLLGLLDFKAASLGKLVRNPPGLIFKLGLFVIRMRESNDVAEVIETLNETPSEGV